MPRSIVARSTLLIVLLATIVGVLFAGGSAWMIQRNEQARLHAQLGELLDTVENTVSIACYVKDEALAREIVHGLMSNRYLAGVRITSDHVVLNEQYRNGVQPPSAAQALVISRSIHSPFKQSETVGEISLYAAKAEIEAQAWNYTRFVVLVLGLEVALVAAGVAWVVFNFVTRPIKTISDELHRLEVSTGMRLRVPNGKRNDEIGRLVGDVNALITKLVNVLDTERRLRLERQASERRLALIFENVDAGIFDVDKDGLLHSWNPGFVRELGAPPQPPMLRSMMQEQATRLDELIDDCLSQGVTRAADFELGAVEGESHGKWVELSLTPVSADMLQGFVNDITERKHAEQAAQRLAQRDALTGLLNRRGLEFGLDAALERRQSEPGLGIAVLQMDLDYFKRVNDNHGHEAGDLVLRRVAEILNGAVRHTDLVARPGGDEFTIVLIGVENTDKPAAIARHIIESMNQPIDLGGGHVVQIGASIGIAMIGTTEKSPIDALRRADAAMYAAKQAGRNAVRLAPSSDEHPSNSETNVRNPD